MKVMNIVAWVLVVVLLIGVGTLAFLNSQQSGRAAGLRDALAQIAITTGVQDLAPEALKDPAMLPDVLQQVQSAIQGAQQELATTKDSLSAAQTEVSGAKAEVSTLKQGFEEQTDKAAAAAKDLAAKEEALAEAKAASEKTAEAMKALEQQKAELEGNLESAKTQLTEETSRLQTELDAALQQVAALETSAAPADSSQSAEEEMAAPAAKSDADAEEGEGQIMGLSQMFSLIRYSEQDQELLCRLRDGQKLTYQNIPLDVGEQLVNAGDIMDKVYLFKIQGSYKSLPPDSVVMRKFWKWQRRHPGRGEVRVVVRMAPPAAVEAAPIEAEEPTEATTAPIK